MTPTNLLQIGNDIDRSVYEQILQFIRLRVTETYAFPPEIVRVDDITIATLGNFSASVGKPKSKKTFNITAIVASALSGKNVLRYNAHLPEGKHKVLYVDTEQSKCHCHKVLERILRLAGLPTDCEADNLEFFMLREYSPKQRRQIINHALASDPGIGFVVIDGIRDLLYDINSPSESVDLINDLMRWSSMHDLHIHTVLHLNKGDDNTRGHIVKRRLSRSLTASITMPCLNWWENTRLHKSVRASANPFPMHNTPRLSGWHSARGT